MQDKEQYWVLGDLYTFHLTSPELSVIEIQSSEGHGPPPHSHGGEDETFYVLPGRLQVTKAGDKMIAEAGDFVHFQKVFYTPSKPSAQKAPESLSRLRRVGLPISSKRSASLANKMLRTLRSSPGPDNVC